MLPSQAPLLRRTRDHLECRTSLQNLRQQTGPNFDRRSVFKNSDRHRLDRPQLLEDHFRRKFQRFAFAARKVVAGREPLVRPHARALPDLVWHDRLRVFVPGRRQ